MRRVIDGSNRDTTAHVAVYLASRNEFRLCNLYMIGEADWPGLLRLTDYESPLLWRPQGLFNPANIQRGRVSSRIGLETTTLDLSYRPTPEYDVYKSIADGYYDNWPVRIWTAFMPTPGDVETYGCAELFGGRIGETQIDRAEIRFTVNSFLDVINQSLPNQVIELTNPLLAFEEFPAEDWGFPYVPPPTMAI